MSSPVFLADVGADPQVILDCHNDLGECVLWDDRERRLWWTNISAAEIWCWDPTDVAEPIRYSMPDRVGSFGFREGGGLILGMASGFALFDPVTGRITWIAEVESELKTTRLNDGRVDPLGRFVCGGMDENVDQMPISAVYVLDQDRSVTRIIDAVHCANSICWSPTGERMYFADMPSRRIRSYAYSQALAVRLIGDFSELGGPGLPDGSQIDAEGFLWNAEWGGGRIVRYRPDGAVDRAIDLPVSNPTCVTFGGPDLDILFITTARSGLDSRTLADQPHAGSLFALRPGVRGRSEYRYLG